jgi:ferredoxin
MPANVLALMSDHAIMWLIRVIPQKVSRIVGELMDGKVRRTNYSKGIVMNWVSRSERENASKLAKGFTVTDDCTSCGWCVRNCPTRNIEIPAPAGKPIFADSCVFCTRCFIGCHSNAIKSKGPFQLKHSLDLDAVERRMVGVELEPVEKCCKGWVFKGVRDYLLDKY